MCINRCVTYSIENFMRGSVCVTLYPHPSPPLKNAGGTLQVKLKLIIMAELNLISLIKAKGHEVSTQFEKLWSAPEVIAEGIEPSLLEIRVSTDYKDSVFAIIRDGKESKLVPFAEGELDPKNLTTDNDGIVTDGLEGMTFSLAEVTALSDRPDLGKKDATGKPVGIKKGSKELKLYVE